MRAALASILATLVFWSPLLPSRARAQDTAPRRVEAADYADRDASLYLDQEEEPAAVSASRELGPAASPEVLERAGANWDQTQEVDPPAVPAEEPTGEGDLSSDPLDLPSGPGKSAVTPQRISLPSGEGSIDGMGESFTPNLSSGTGTFSVPIAVPAGRNGVQPSLSLSYSTAGGNGPVGLGWGLAAPFISRQTDKELPAYADQAEWSEQEDTFMYNGGQELVPVRSEDATAVDGAPVPDALFGWQQYRARVEGGFMRFFRSPGSERWVVQAKDGTRFDFGLTPNARAADPEDETRVFQWSLSRMSDAHGSTVHYRYIEDGGRLYLSDVYYGSPNQCASPDDPARARDCAAPFEDYGRRVRLVYRGRPDATSSYVTGWRVETAWRLERIELTSHMGEVGKRYLVRRYHLSYDDESYHSLLQSVQVEGRPSETDSILGVQVGNALIPEEDLDGNVIGDLLPPMRFGYTAAAATSDLVPGFGGLDLTVHRAAASPGHGADGSRADLFDVNKDGLPDLLVTDPARFEHGAGVYFNGFDEEGIPTEAGSFSKSVRVGIPDGKTGTMRLGNTNVRPMDMDGDGQSDLVHMPPHSRYGHFFLTKAPNDNGVTSPVSGWNFEYAQSALPAEDTDQRIDLGGGSPTIRMVDVNNDHLVDVVKTTGTDILTWLNLGNFEGGEGRFGSAEWDGTGHSLSTEPLETCLPYAGRKLGFDDPRVRLADMNGDGLQDIVFLRSNDVVYWPGRGRGVWGEGPAQCSDPDNRHTAMSDSPAIRNVDTADVRLVDVNADGASDIVLIKPHEISVWFNRGGESFAERLLAPHDGLHQSSAPHLSGRVRAADLDGSGTIDIVYADANDWRWIDLMGGVRPRLLTRVDNGLGALTTLEYGSSVEDYLTDLADARTCNPEDLDCFTWERSVCEDQAADCVHRAGANPVVSTVVRSVSSTDRLDALGADPTVTTTLYGYHDGYYEGIEHEFRGFGAADAVVLGDADEPTSITRTWFHQGRRPNDILSDRLADNPNEALKGREFLSETFDANGVYLSTKHASYTVRKLLHGRNDVGVSYAFVGSSDEFRYDVSQFSPAAQTVPLPSVVRQTAGPGLVQFQQLAADPGPIHEVPVRAHEYAHLRTTIDEVDNVGNLRQQTAHGRVDRDEVITSHSVPVRVDDGAACGRTQWLWRTAETYVTGAGYSGQLGHTNNQYTTCGDLRVASQEALLPNQYPEGFEFGSDGRGARAYSQRPQTLIASSSFDAWGQAADTCVGADVSADPSACLRYGSVVFDEAYGQFPVAETVRATAHLDLTTSALWDPGLGVLRSATDPNGLSSEVYYDGLGRLTSTMVPNVAGCEDLRVPTTRIHYQLTDDPAALPLSSVRTETVLDCKDPTSDAGTLEAVAFVDGLGRPRVALAEGSLNPATWSDDKGHPWLRSGLQTFTAKGQVHDAWQPDFYDGSAAPSSDLLARPSDDVGFVSTSYDAFGRGAEAVAEDRTSRTVTLYGALDQTVCDPNDLAGPLYMRGTCARESKDGHGRTVSQRLINAREGGGGREFHYLFSYYRPDGAVTRIVRAKGDEYAERPTPQNAGLEAWVERSFVYDSLGRRLASFDADTDNPVAASDITRSWRYLFNPAGDLAAVRDPRGCGQNFFYDLAGRLVGEQYVGCDEAQLAAEPFAGVVPADSIGLGRIEAEEAVHVKYLFDAYDREQLALAELPTGARGTPQQADVLGLATGVWDRGHRSAVGYDDRGNPIWGKRELAVISEAAELTIANRRGAIPQLNEGPEVARVGALGGEIHYDTAHPYVHTASYDHAGRSQRLRLPTDPDVDNAPDVEGALHYTEHGAPASAVAHLNDSDAGVPVVESIRYTRDGLVSETVYGDGHERGATFSTTEYDARRRPTRMTTMRDAEPEDGPLRAAQTLGAVSVVVDQSLEWGPANNLLHVYDQRVAEEWPVGHLPQTTHVRHDALYRVGGVEFEYGGPEGENTADIATDWRDTEARHRGADPMRATAAPMLPTMPIGRVQSLEYEHDWLANMTVWNDNADSFYERSIGNITNGADVALGSGGSARPSALYLASNLNSANPADVGGWLEVDYGLGGNMTSMTVHARCQAAPLRTCEDPRGAELSARRQRMRDDCVCAAEQHYSYRWDELNRLSEARRFDRRDGEWILQARQRYRYTSGNVRVIKQTLSSDDGLGTDENGAGQPGVILDLDSAALADLGQGQLLPTWAGRVGEASQQDPALQPAVGVLDGHPTVRFDGSNDSLELGQVGETPAYTAVLVGGWEARSGTDESLWSGVGDAGGPPGATLLAAGGQAFRLQQAGTELAGGDSSRGGMRVLGIRVDATAGFTELYVDGERVGREAVAPQASELGGFLGCTPGATGAGTCFSGHLARFIVYDGALTIDELDQLQQDLLSRYSRPRPPEPATPAILTADPCADVGDACANLAVNGSLEEGLTSWVGGRTHEAEEVALALETADTVAGGAALRVDVRSEGGDTSYTGAQLALTEGVSAGRFARVQFDAKWLEGAKHLKVGRVGAGAASYSIEMSRKWQRYTVDVEFLGWGSNIVFSPTAVQGGPYRLPPADGLFLLDNVRVVAADTPTPRPAERFRADQCASIAGHLRCNGLVGRGLYAASEPLHDNLAQNGDIEEGLSRGWASGEGETQDSVVLTAESADTPSGSGTSLHVNVETGGGDFRQTGALLTLGPTVVGNGRTARVLFDAKRIGGATHLVVNRRGGGAFAAYVELSDQWQRYSVHLEALSHGASVLLFSLVDNAGDRTVSSGEFLLDNVVVADVGDAEEAMTLPVAPQLVTEDSEFAGHPSWAFEPDPDAVQPQAVNTLLLPSDGVHDQVTVFVVASRQDAEDDVGRSTLWRSEAAPDGPGEFTTLSLANPQPGGSRGVAVEAGTNRAESAEGLDARVPVIVSFRAQQGGLLELFRDGVYQGATDQVGPTALGGRLGAAGLDNDQLLDAFRGRVAEFVAFDRALDDGEMDEVHAYLATRYTTAGEGGDSGGADPPPVEEPSDSSWEPVVYGATQQERIALYVSPGDYERRGLVVSPDGTTYEPAEDGRVEAQYLVAGARIVWQGASIEDAAGAGSTLEPDHRITFALTNLIQSTSAVVDLRSGELLEATTFYPNGARETWLSADDEVNGADVPLEPIGFTGKEADTEVGLVYFGERYLVPRIGRWASPDPLWVHAQGGGEVMNAYHYVSGNLLQARDPLGLDQNQTDADANMSVCAGGSGGCSAGSFSNSNSTFVPGEAPTDAYDLTVGQSRWLANDQAAFDEWFNPEGFGPPAVGAPAPGSLKMSGGNVVATCPAGTCRSALEEAKDIPIAGSLLGLATAENAHQQNSFGIKLVSDLALTLGPLAAAPGLRLAMPGLLKRTPSPKIYSKTADLSEIVASGRVWGQTEGSVYGMTMENAPRWRSMVDTKVRDAGTLVFEGQAASLFKPHPVEGLYSGMKRLLGQQKAGFGDLAFNRATSSLSGDVLTIRHATLVPHAGQSTAKAAARLWGRRAFELSVMGAAAYSGYTLMSD